MDVTPQQVVEHPEHQGRNVTLICGPPGSGKTTLGLHLHPETLDIGEMPAGTPRERMRLFGLIAYRVGRSPHANVAVIRGAPTAAERQHQQKLCRPSRTVVMLTDADECHRRIAARNRHGIDGRDLAGQHDAVDAWWIQWLTETPQAHTSRGTNSLGL